MWISRASDDLLDVTRLAIAELMFELEVSAADRTTAIT